MQVQALLKSSNRVSARVCEANSLYYFSGSFYDTYGHKVKCKRNVPTEQKNREVGSFDALQLFLSLILKVNISGWIEHLISRPIARKISFVALLFISIFDLRFLQEEYARRVSMKYFKNIPDRVWSVCEANSLKIEMS